MENCYFSPQRWKKIVFICYYHRVSSGHGWNGWRDAEVEGEQLKEEMEQLRCRNESCRPQQMSGSRSADSESSWLMKRQMQTVAHVETSALLSCTVEKRREEKTRREQTQVCSANRMKRATGKTCWRKRKPRLPVYVSWTCSSSHLRIPHHASPLYSIHTWKNPIKYKTNTLDS